MYTIENAPIDYYIQFEDQQTGTDQGDHYQPTYNNSPTSGHGSATDALYNNGSMTIRPIGNTSYSATKDWLDGNSTQRGEVTFTLWRYAANALLVRHKPHPYSWITHQLQILISIQWSMSALLYLPTAQILLILDSFFAINTAAQ